VLLPAAGKGARRLTEELLNGVSRAQLAYEGDGVRTGKTAGGATTTYVNDTRSLSQVLQETRSGTTITLAPGLSQYNPAGGPRRPGEATSTPTRRTTGC